VGGAGRIEAFGAPCQAVDYFFLFLSKKKKNGKAMCPGAKPQEMDGGPSLKKIVNMARQ
jgi:hypothetical protein